MSRSAAWVVFLKECRESLRDRRVLINALLIGPLLGPLMFVIVLRLTVARQIEQAARPLPVAVAGAAQAPNLVAALEQQGLQLLAAPADLAGAVRSQQLDLALRIPSGYADAWRAGRPAQLELFYDSSRQGVLAEVQRLEGMLQGYSQRNAALRLMARGLSPTLSAPIVIAARDQATPQGRGALMFAMLPYFLVFTALIGGMWLAIDSTAGERERGSLEPLLINPVPRDRILLGKVLATALFGLASLTLGSIAFMVAGWFLPGDQIGLSFNLGPRVVGAILPVMLPLVLLIAVTEILVTAFAKTAREAQAHMALVQILPAITSVVLSFAPIKSALWMYAVPLLGQQLIILRLLRGESIATLAAILAAVFTLAAALVVFWAARRSYATERLAISS
ncbi:MAG TPA: ABC transporter permease subunit [Steroidobacteraceae bacterium]|nr:ABC transporter permease subunit [Steroidobacteraceae bacterium]